MSDLEKTQEMQDLNWTPAAQYWKSKFEKAEADLALARSEIEDLKAELAEETRKLSLYQRIVRALYPHLSMHYFICGESTPKDQNGLPAAIHICPAYGADWSAIYRKVEAERVDFEGLVYP
jgi:hypothetical protein